MLVTYLSCKITALYHHDCSFPTNCATVSTCASAEPAPPHHLVPTPPVVLSPPVVGPPQAAPLPPVRVVPDPSLRPRRVARNELIDLSSYSVPTLPVQAMAQSTRGLKIFSFDQKDNRTLKPSMVEHEAYIAAHGHLDRLFEGVRKNFIENILPSTTCEAECEDPERQVQGNNAQSSSSGTRECGGFRYCG